MREEPFKMSTFANWFFRVIQFLKQKGRGGIEKNDQTQKNQNNNNKADYYFIYPKSGYFNFQL